MKYRVDFNANNVCRVFELPLNFPSEFCFGGPIWTHFKMVDWFNPVHPLCESEEVDGDDLQTRLAPWILGKPYIVPGLDYLVLCEFGLAFVCSKAVEDEHE